MSIVSALTEKSWLHDVGRDDRILPEEGEPWDRGVGVNVFLAVVTILFTLVTSAYIVRMGLHGEALGHAGSDWHRIAEPPLLWFNTGLLVLSSLAFHAAFAAARAGRAKAVRRSVLAGGALGLGFVIGQLVLWRLLNDWGYVLSLSVGVCTPVANPLAPVLPITRSGNPAIAFFYLISGLHALHIIGGLAAWAVTARRIFGAAAAGGAGTVRAVQLCARYWDYMLLVWIVMMGLFVLS